MVNSAEPVLAEVWRGDYLECVHHGGVAVSRPGGGLALRIGDVDSPMLPRSAIKPLQAIAMLRSGLDVSGAELALVGASHSGEDFHVATATAILAGAGLGTGALQTTPGLPLDDAPLAAWLRSGRGKEPVVHNCSGKHAGMLRTCVRAGWSIDDYLDPGHPLQRSAREVLAEFGGEDAGDPVVDGCGAPAFPMTLAGLARAFGTVAAAGEGEAKAVADAFRAHPEYASGTARYEVVLHREVPGLVCKLGAEGTLAVGLADGTGIAVKVGDGHQRAAVAVLVAVLDALGLGTPRLAALDPYPVLGHGRPVGRVTVAADIAQEIAALSR